MAGDGGVGAMCSRARHFKGFMGSCVYRRGHSPRGHDFSHEIVNLCHGFLFRNTQYWLLLT